MAFAGHAILAMIDIEFGHLSAGAAKTTRSPVD
jgi:hypothetical protein